MTTERRAPRAELFGNQRYLRQEFRGLAPAKRRAQARGMRRVLDPWVDGSERVLLSFDHFALGA